jgi:hypothetical protein
MGGPGIPLSQTAWRGRNDDGTEITATWKAGVERIWQQPTDEIFRFRFLIQREPAPTAANGYLSLWVSHNKEVFQLCARNDDYGPETVAQPLLSDNFEEYDDTTQQIGSELFQPLNDCMSDGEEFGLAWGDTFTFPKSSGAPYEVEAEFALQIIGASVSPGDTLEFRCRYLGLPLPLGYPSVPILVIPGDVAGTDTRLRIKGGPVVLKGSSLIIK